jgi:hypothetical protein
MWSSTHGAVGGAIMMVTPDPFVGVGLAFVSHFVMDYIGETNYRDNVEAFIVELLLFVVYMAATSLHPQWWLLVFGWFFANLPDLIDKPRRLIWEKDEWFSCHNGVGLFQSFGIKLGYPVLWRLSYQNTMIWNISSTLVFVIMVLITS